MASSKPRLLRLASYRPILDRTIFGLALLGILTSVHLGIQQERGFDQGCFGFTASQQVEDTFDCAAVTESTASSLFGLSNTTWGLLFYLAVATLTALAAFNVGGKLSQYKKTRAILILAGFLYTLYLVYFQFFGIGELCALCLTSAGITTLLLVTQVIDYQKTTPSKMHASMMVASEPRRELTYMGVLALVLITLVGADFAYFDSVDIAGPDIAMDDPALAVSENYPGDPSMTGGECLYDPEKATVEDASRLVTLFDPAKGNPNASVTVVEYFDPNCPHCKTMHPIVERVADTHADKAHFVFKPFVLWPHSIAQSEALYAAAQEGKFFEMLNYQYAIQQPQTGLSLEQLRAIAQEIGMNTDVLMQRLESGIYRRTLSQQKDIAIEAGVTGTPAVLINGRFVDGQSRTVECLQELIDQASEAAQASQAEPEEG